MTYQCPACGKKAMNIPWTFIVESRVTAKCTACGNTHTSTLSGAMNSVRGAVIGFIAAALGTLLLVFLPWWKEWVVALVALLTLDAVWRLYLHKSAIQRSGQDAG